MNIPPFLLSNSGSGHLYALAYVTGQYTSPGPDTLPEAFFILYFSSSKDTTRFCISTVSPSGEVFHYSQGVAELDSAEYMMLQAWREQMIPLHAWRFFSTEDIAIDAFPDDQTRTAYEKARHRIAHIIFQARNHVWIQSQFPTEPLFRFNAAELPEPLASTPELEDIANHLKH
jgi:hypothetical protein